MAVRGLHRIIYISCTVCCDSPTNIYKCKYYIGELQGMDTTADDWIKSFLVATCPTGSVIALKESQGIEHTELFLVDLLKQPETVCGMPGQKCFLIRL